MFQFPPSPFVIDDSYASVVCGFPHSEIRASSVICTYTRLIAACHVLHRLSVPGHPPCALSSLTFVLNKHFLCLFSEIFPSKIEFHKNPKSQNTLLLLMFLPLICFVFTFENGDLSAIFACATPKLYKGTARGGKRR